MSLQDIKGALLKSPRFYGGKLSIVKDALDDKRSEKGHFDKEDPDDVDTLFNGTICLGPKKPAITHEHLYDIPPFRPAAWVGSHAWRQGWQRMRGGYMQGMPGACNRMCLLLQRMPGACNRM